MLSNEPSNIPPGQHRRQNSTPTVFDTLKVPLPATKSQHGSHRRGSSLDQPTKYFQPHRKMSQQDDQIVRTKDYEQHQLRETQQQQQQLARPGQQQQMQPKQPHHNEGSLRDLQPKSYPEYGLGTLTHNRLIVENCTSHKATNLNAQDIYTTETTNNTKTLDSTKFAGYLEGFEFEALRKALDVELNKSSIPQDERNKKSEDIFMPHAGCGGPLQQYTPTTQIDSSYFPMTPHTSSYTNLKKPSQSAGIRTAGCSPTRKDPNLTIRASEPMKRGTSLQNVFNAGGEPFETHELPSPPRSASHVSSRSVDIATFPRVDFSNMSKIHTDFPSNDAGYGSSHCSPTSIALSSTVSSFQSSPAIPRLQLIHDEKTGMPGHLKLGEIFGLPAPQLDLDPSGHPSEEIQQSRSQSVSDFALDATMEDTGITPEEISAFMYGPRPSDGRWVCTFPGCTRDFGRKENIKSHVQTHLGDRQFICKICGNDFVRQHDLKRHAKIHSGVKPYTCPCGRNFARHDALTRHRQRNTCEGGFEGMSKTPTKRGRPKKMRPDLDTRLDKAAKTRQRALEKASSPSVSSSSECSFPSPPQFSDELDDAPGRKPLDFMEVLQANLTDYLSNTPPASPSHNTGDTFSAQHSRHSHTPKGVSMSPSPKILPIPEEPPDTLPSHAMSRESSTNYHSTPPDLDNSSSSPVVSSFLDFDLGFKATLDAPEAKNSKESKGSSLDFDSFRSDPDIDEMFLDSFNNQAMTDKGSMFPMDGFDDPYASGNWADDGFDPAMEAFFSL